MHKAIVSKKETNWKLKINQKARKTCESDNNRLYSPSKRFYCKMLTIYLQIIRNSEFKWKEKGMNSFFLLFFFSATNEKVILSITISAFATIDYCYCQCYYIYKLSFRCEWDVSRTVPVWETKNKVFLFISTNNRLWMLRFQLKLIGRIASHTVSQFQNTFAFFSSILQIGLIEIGFQIEWWTDFLLLELLRVRL